MKNMDLNVGGFLGALAGVGLAAATYFLWLAPDDGQYHSTRGPAKLSVLAVVGGAAAGNFLWSKLFSRP